MKPTSSSPFKIFAYEYISQGTRKNCANDISVETINKLPNNWLSRKILKQKKIVLYNLKLAEVKYIRKKLCEGLCVKLTHEPGS